MSNHLPLHSTAYVASVISRWVPRKQCPDCHGSQLWTIRTAADEFQVPCPRCAPGSRISSNTDQMKREFALKVVPVTIVAVRTLLRVMQEGQPPVLTIEYETKPHVGLANEVNTFATSDEAATKGAAIVAAEIRREESREADSGKRPVSAETIIKAIGRDQAEIIDEMRGSIRKLRDQFIEACAYPSFEGPKVEGNSITKASMLRWVNKILDDAGLDEIDREEIQERRE